MYKILVAELVQMTESFGNLFFFFKALEVLKMCSLQKSIHAFWLNKSSVQFYAGFKFNLL